ncbi:G-patch-domain-containing protein [Backusella circina FSU 941]|nr:G-patch-domain-containing protein [Backusella circina FSU 941]
MPRHQQPIGYVDYDTTTQVSMETHIPASNIGYKLLQKMGWTAGKGLGSQGQGRVDPIRIELKDDSLGVGKAEELMSNHISSTAKRKAMEMEKQLDESLQQKEQRETMVEKNQAIAKELEEVKRAFYCELCDKQYKKISEYEQHLQSYDHHHKKRFKDMKESTRQSSANQNEREKKLAREKKREERELKRMQEALLKRTGGVSQPPPPKVPLHQSTTKNTTASSTGGWSTISATPTSSGGGWSTVDTRVVGSMTPSGGGDGRTTVEPVPDKKGSGWSTVESTDSDTNKAINEVASIKPKPDQSSSPAKPPTTKMSFGIKKTGGFQFGLKKK